MGKSYRWTIHSLICRSTRNMFHLWKANTFVVSFKMATSLVRWSFSIWSPSICALISGLVSFAWARVFTTSSSNCRTNIACFWNKIKKWRITFMNMISTLVKFCYFISICKYLRFFIFLISAKVHWNIFVIFPFYNIQSQKSKIIKWFLFFKVSFLKIFCKNLVCVCGVTCHFILRQMLYHFYLSEGHSTEDVNYIRVFSFTIP